MIALDVGTCEGAKRAAAVRVTSGPPTTASTSRPLEQSATTCSPPPLCLSRLTPHVECNNGLISVLQVPSSPSALTSSILYQPCICCRSCFSRRPRSTTSSSATYWLPALQKNNTPMSHVSSYCSMRALLRNSSLAICVHIYHQFFFHQDL